MDMDAKARELLDALEAEAFTRGASEARQTRRIAAIRCAFEEVAGETLDKAAKRVRVLPVPDGHLGGLPEDAYHCAIDDAVDAIRLTPPEPKPEPAHADEGRAAMLTLLGGVADGGWEDAHGRPIPADVASEALRIVSEAWATEPAQPGGAGERCGSDVVCPRCDSTDVKPITGDRWLCKDCRYEELDRADLEERADDDGMYIFEAPSCTGTGAKGGGE